MTTDIEIEFLEETSVFQIDKKHIRLEVRKDLSWIAAQAPIYKYWDLYL